MNRLDELKNEMLLKYPSIKTLRIFDRIRAFFGPEYEITHQKEVPEWKGHMSQTAILTIFKGKEYIKRFGRLG